MVLLVALVSSLSVIAVFSSAIYLFGSPRFKPFVWVSFSQLESNPQSWLGKRVRISGTLRCGLMHIPEAIPPCNCVLSSFTKSESVGVRIHNNFVYNEYNNRNVTVFGVFKEGETGPLIMRTVYYVDAEIVMPIQAFVIVQYV